MITLSASKVGAYLGCPLKYRFQYVDKIDRPWRPAALAFGSSVHAAAEWLRKEQLAGRRPEAEAVLAVFDADWYAQNVEPLVFAKNDSKESLGAKGRAMLRLYVDHMLKRTPKSAEKRFTVDLVDPQTGEILDVRLSGIIDAIEDDGTVVELKTAGRTLEAGGLERHLQLSLYALASFLTDHQLPRLRLELLLKTKTPRLETHETTRTVEDLSWTVRLVEGVASASEAGHFFPNPSWRCTECEYYAHCQRWRGRNGG